MATPTTVLTSTLITASGQLTDATHYWRGGDLTYSFPFVSARWPTYSAGEAPFDPFYAPLNGGQQAQFRAAMAAWDVAFPFHFNEVPDGTTFGQFRVAFSGRFGTATAPLNGRPAAGEEKPSDIFLPSTARESTLAPYLDAEDFTRLLKEIGAGLGFRILRPGGPLGDYNNERYTVMSVQGISDGNILAVEETVFGPQIVFRSVAPTTPMVLDIFQMEVIYGPANGGTMNAHPGDTVYKFAPGAAIMQTLLDTGGVDTIDLSDHTRPSSITMTDGTYSSVDYYPVAQQKADLIARYPQLAAELEQRFAFGQDSLHAWSANLAIAYKTMIENVRAGSGNDTVVGNLLGNVISGGAGHDQLFGAAGSDTVDGGVGQNYLRGDDGNDSIVGGGDFDDINGNMGSDTASGGAGDDWVVGGKDSDLLFGDAGNDLVYGNLGNDTCEGGDGNDIIRGGQDNDVVRGGAGDDYVSGDRGDDTMTGGDGADIFHSFGEAGIDRVTDFSAAQGDRVQLDPGTQYTVAQVGADTVISMTGGGQMTLVGVQLSTLAQGWILGA